MKTFQSDKERAHLVLGGPTTGKTTRLAQAAMRACAESDERIAVIGADKARASHLRETLGATAADRCEVLSIEELALNIAADYANTHPSKRQVRILDNNEEAMLFEDLRSSGLKQRRLRQIVAFLEHGWNALDDNDANWLQTLEEKLIADTIERRLEFAGGYLSSRIASHALKCLLNDPALDARHKRAHMFVDDLHLLSRSQQMLVYQIAGESLFATADKLVPIRKRENYANELFLDEFQQRFCDATIEKATGCYAPNEMVCLMNNARSRIDETCEALVCKSASDDGAKRISVHSETTPEEELRFLLRSIAQAHASDTDLSRIALVGANKDWLKGARQACSRCGVPTRKTAAGKSALPFQSEDACTAQERLIIERLRRDPDDSLAWRTWCGIGDYLARSVGIEQLRERYAADGETLASALRRLENDDPDSSSLLELRERYRLGTILIASADAECASSHDGQQVSNGIFVGTPEDLGNETFDIVLFGGFVNGFIPSRSFCDPGQLVGSARAREEHLCLQAIAACARSAREQLVFSSFSQCSLEMAEKLDLHIARIRLREQKRSCDIEASLFLELVQSSMR